jgi:hypothetical protein
MNVQSMTKAIKHKHQLKRGIEMPTINNNYYTETEAAKELGVKVKTLRAWAALKKGPPRAVVGRNPFYRINNLVNWVGKQEKVFTKTDERGV